MSLPDKLSKVLIVRFSSIGDIVLTSPVVRAIKKQLGVQIHYLTKQKYQSLLENNPYIDRIFSIEEEITEVVGDLREEKYDLIVDLHKNLRTKRLIFLLKKPFLTFEKLNIEKWLWVNLRVNKMPKLHIVDRYFSGLKSLGIVHDGEGLDYFHGLDKDKILPLLPKVPYAVLVLGAKFFTKRIPQEKLEIIIGHSRLPVFLIGGKDVEQTAVSLKKKYPKITNYVGQLDVNQSAAVIAGAWYMVTGDTGMMHIGAGLKVPMIVFWGGTHFDLGMWPYYGEKHQVKCIHLYNQKIKCSPCSKIGKDFCPKAHFDCMMGIHKEKIIDAIREMESGVG